MVKEGPIPAFVHGLLEYVVGAALIALPLIIGYESGAATAVSIVLGVGVIFLAATTDSSTSLIDQVPLSAHVILDYVLAALLIASPFLFGFSDETEPTVVFLVGGVLHLLVSIGTRYRKEEKPKRREVGSGDSGDSGVRDEEIPEFEPPRRER